MSAFTELELLISDVPRPTHDARVRAKQLVDEATRHAVQTVRLRLVVETFVLDYYALSRLSEFDNPVEVMRLRETTMKSLSRLMELCQASEGAHGERT
ncbi:hypothetical protein [Pseudaminobacter soli (ex Li et al. 2025)]|uniref:Uncharacterized protein n=1 Tax=Pseudaminobacter soli (ex Li et al. 2025) TaxID=1295366 RepID=A0A2P7RZM3_9HYPH|nr:hypothetical protein [Mesorhizobium soli]PSJ55643.1 hypothetical protein C7I85_26725 [Mesorhizobium soli]